MVKLNLEKKLIGFIIVCGAAILTVAILIIWPTINKIRQARSSVYELRLFLEKRERHAVQIHNSLQYIDKLENDTANYRDFFTYRQGDTLALITALENLAARHDINQKIDQASFDKIINHQLRLKISIIGRYPQVLSYLYDFERLPYFLNIRQFNLAPAFDRSNPAASPGNVALNLDVSLYVEP